MDKQRKALKNYQYTAKVVAVMGYVVAVLVILFAMSNYENMDVTPFVTVVIIAIVSTGIAGLGTFAWLLVNLLIAFLKDTN